MKKRLVQLISLLLGVGVAAGGVAVLTGAAQAGTHRSKSYNVTKTLNTDLGACVKVSLYGKLEWDVKSSYSKYVGQSYVYNRTLVNPVMTVKALGGTKCRSSKKLTEVTMTQRWYNHTCSITPNISVAYPPFAVGAAPTINCGNVTVASRESSSSASAASYKQSNSGRPVRFAETATYKNACMNVDAYVTAGIKNRNDSIKTSFKICP
ncbi:hypothetical protein AB0J86_37865 [Micromonospora sp. NPDC049559]|uniref:hypothetical protein n=1 Tax=Micromonospora sp. NPDC049559 TaxID=3155923 RepID=UPI00341611B6